MRQTLQLRMGQHLAMTPRLQQAIRLLQLSTTELLTEVREALDSNLMLEEEDEGAAGGPAGADGSGEVGNTHGAGGAVEPADVPHELPVDGVWEDACEPAPVDDVRPDGPGGEFDGADPGAHRAQTESLKDRLQWQMSTARFSDVDRVIGTAIIDAVNEDGYLTLTLEEIRQSLDPLGEEVALGEVEAVLRQIQNFDPPGVAARDPGECLALQLRQLPAGTEWRDAALALVEEGHLPLLASRDHRRLMQALGLGRDELRCVIELIRSLSPRPGSAVEPSAPEYVVPDVFVRRERGAWRVALNPDASPRLRVNPRYAGLVRRADDSADNNTLKSHLQEARWLIRSLQSRSETLLKVATCIVEHQRGFLEHGEEAMKPMVLADVAQVVDVHESTVSRVTTRKYMHTPRGVFELKHFFSSHVYTLGGSEASSTAIRAVLRKLIEAEDPARPLSDNRLAAILSGQGIRIARRTVAKYREAMAIPSSTERRAAP